MVVLLKASTFRFFWAPSPFGLSFSNANVLDDRELIFGLTVQCSIDWRSQIQDLKSAITLPAAHLTQEMKYLKNHFRKSIMKMLKFNFMDSLSKKNHFWLYLVVTSLLAQQFLFSLNKECRNTCVGKNEFERLAVIHLFCFPAYGISLINSKWVLSLCDFSFK